MLLLLNDEVILYLSSDSEVQRQDATPIYADTEILTDEEFAPLTDAEGLLLEMP